jgi:flagellar biosynthesis/type III secretory pathway chaperone
MENLIDVLEKESSEYEGLLELSQKKTPIIVSGDLEQLKEITDDEQETVGRIGNLEKKRLEVTADIANVLNKDVNTLKLANLIEMLSARPAERDRLAAAHDRLGNAVRNLQRINEQNKELLSNALEMVEFEMNMIQATKAAPETANYNRDAHSSGITYGVVSTGFDAKQ